MKQLLFATPFVFAVLAGSEHTASASQLFFEYIPASACQPEHEEDISKIEFTKGSWAMNSGIDDSVTLLCPIRSSHFFATPSVTTLIWPGIEAFYRDPDGNGLNHDIEFEIVQVNTSSLTESVLFTFNTSAESIFTVHSRIEIDLIFVLGALLNAQHYIRVTMVQGGGTDRVTLTRVALLAVPPG